ncbi:hypothetical protein [Salsuginibacillus kocurii]|uniref:hypothetical protein n=1 Tax=Salsuginibacillus kocurii TaxID=427078 RepID=UPI00036E551D|nr:hypothetical protein [Salsuginibacillus kocurii]
MKIDRLETADQERIDFTEGELHTNEEPWSAVLHGVDNHGIIFESVSDNIHRNLQFETENGTYTGQAVVSNIESEKENRVTLEGKGPLNKV